MSVPAFPYGDGSAVNPEPVRQLPPVQAGCDPGRFEPCWKGGRRGTIGLVSEERDDLRHEADMRCEVPVLPGVDRRGVGTEKLRDVGLPEAQIETTGADVIAECPQLGRLGRGLWFLSS